MVFMLQYLWVVVPGQQVVVVVVVVVVEICAGAGGTVGAQSVVRAEPDGCTLLLAASPEVSIAPTTLKALAYDPVKDLKPIIPALTHAHPVKCRARSRNGKQKGI